MCRKQPTPYTLALKYHETPYERAWAKRNQRHRPPFHRSCFRAHKLFGEMGERGRQRAVYLGDGLADGGVEELHGVAGVPAAVAVVEVELHEVARDGGDEHVAGLAANGVVELEDAVVPGPARPRLHRPARQDLRHGLGN